MLQCNILVGNIGSGKSTIAHKLALKGMSVVNMDSIQESIAGGIYGAYDPDKKNIYHDIEETAIKASLSEGISVCIDRTNMDKKRRARFINIAKEFTNNINCYDFGAGTEKQLDKRIVNGRGIPAETWEKVYAFMKKTYEKPDLSEGFSNIIIPPEKFEFHAFDFDGTICVNNFPGIGDLVDGTVEKINDLYQDIKNIIIIWSCRSDNYEAQMRSFLLKNKIPFDFINKNPILESGSRKIFAHKYYDDRNS